MADGLGWEAVVLVVGLQERTDGTAVTHQAGAGQAARQADSTPKNDEGGRLGGGSFDYLSKGKTAKQ
jgi:hypothetical protein